MAAFDDCWVLLMQTRERHASDLKTKRPMRPHPPSRRFGQCSFKVVWEGLESVPRRQLSHQTNWSDVLLISLEVLRHCRKISKQGQLLGHGGWVLSGKNRNTGLELIGAEARGGKEVESSIKEAGELPFSCETRVRHVGLISRRGSCPKQLACTIAAGMLNIEYTHVCHHRKLKLSAILS